MRIGIDARFYGPLGKGIGRYTQQLIAHLEKLDQENEYFIFLRQENFDLYKPKSSNFHRVLADYSWYSSKEQIFFPLKLYKYHLDLVHFLHFNVPILYRRKFVVTVHDLIIHTHASKKASTLPFPLFYFKKLAYFLIIKLAVGRAKKIITVSLFSKKEIIKYYKVKPEKIIVTYEAA